MSSSNIEELGIRLSALGVPETTAGVALAGQAVEDYGKKVEAAGKPMGGTTAAMGQMGKSAKEVQAAWRLLPAQITDVVTSLASGQPAWLIAIQQGGQIKDSFGGVGPMFREITAALGPARLAAGGAAAGVLLLLMAHQQGAHEAQAYNQALIMTGNAAGTNAGQMADMARSIAQAVGTQGKAAQALAAMASTGEVAQRNLQGFADLAIRMERTLDQPLSETAQRFTDLGRAPLEATLRLNRGVNYLTAALYEEIRALMAAGREADAGALAQKAYAEAMSTRTAKVASNLGLLERAWVGVKDAAKSSWDEMLSYGREDTLSQRLAKAKSDIERFRALPNQGGGGLLGMWEESRYEKALQAVDLANRDLIRVQERGMEASGAVAQAQEALRQLDQSRVEAALAIELAQARAAATQREAIINRDLAVSQAAARQREALQQRQSATLESLRDRDSVGTADYFERRKTLEQQGLQSQIQVVDAQISAEARLAQSRAAVIDAEISAEARRKPENAADASQQQARLIELAARRGEVEIQQESKIIELKAQRGSLVAQQAAAEVAADRATESAGAAAQDRFIDDLNQRRQALSQFSEQLRYGNASAAVDLIADPYKRATERAKLDIAELNRYYTEQAKGLKARLAIAEILQPDAVDGIKTEMTQAEQRKADAIDLINRRMVQDLKPEWQQMLEAWKDNTRLMREAYDDFQTGWLRAGESGWVEFIKTGKVNIESLTDFALGEFAKLTYRQQVAPMMQQAGDTVAGWMGIAKPAAEALGDGAGSAAKSAEAAAVTSNTAAVTAGTAAVTANTAALGAATSGMAAQATSLTLGTVALDSLTSAATSAALALSTMSSSGSGGGGGGGGFAGMLASLFSNGGGEAAATVAHTGAIMGAGEGRAASFPVNTWAGARRYHTGGLAHDEVPAILQRGEGVFTKGQMRALAPVEAVAKAGGSSRPSITQHVTIHIDARTDQAQVASLALMAVRQAKAEMRDEMERGTA
ncbi:phage tail length tape measure family protein [Paucibacter sp. Y2R2-4]|uniref:phage tail length tape measure family protein n=1 Tax=Paucibacter sp. Y2R2-4 TaxID=2893553 RepID=UPI0021E3E4D2|nr:phage tail length tape measure family protein [Paucibacter sp. Y2R2-4]MCV2349337.1 phage tail length tape measure family protein [Paucibacter sp. Y2R2-4]